MSHELRHLNAADAPQLVELFRSCYGETYGTAYFYDAEELVALIEDRTLRSVVATDDERVIGHMGITIRHPGARVCETGNTVVHPDARGGGLLKMLAEALRARVLEEGFVGYIHYPTTAHPIMQKSSVSRGGVETGIMLAYVAADTEYEGIERPTGRLAATVVYQPLAPMPERTVILPTRYRDLLLERYERMGVDRRTESAASSESQTSELLATYNSRRRILSAYINQSGQDLGAKVDKLIREHQPEVSYIDLPLDDPGIDAAIKALRELGFFYAAVLPDFARTDLLRLQAIHRPDAQTFDPALANPDAQRLCAFIRTDAPLDKAIGKPGT